MISQKTIRQTFSIDAPTAKVWDALTNPAQLKQWLSDAEVRVVSEWRTGSDILFYGTMHGKPYMDKGTILRFEPDSVFQYAYLSCFSKLPDTLENHAVLTFRLTPEGNGTNLDVTVGNCVTEAIFAHLNFYWTVTPVILKRFIEQ
jgi:uncharacterized protein YndB with AHSA1/START domain